jgi:D-alanyl-D-alanine carboxypeptidase (penicillin-binding protein 5/6)
MKKLFILLIGTAICLSIITFPKTKAKISLADEFCYKSKSYCLMDYNSGEILLGENLDERLPIASMCKIMTLVLCFEEIENGNLSFDTKICVSENASGMGGSQVFLETNGEYLVETLIKSITIASANDACVAMAEQICGTEKLFVDKMNEKASLLGMQNTNFVNATGLPSPGQYSTANDVAIMFRELIKYKDYFRFSTIWMDKVDHNKERFTEISNTNKLIKFYNGCDGGKTGYTSEAGHCLSATAKRDDLRLIAVVIKAPDSKTRFNEVSTLFNTGFANYKNKQILSKNKPINKKFKVENSNLDEISVIPKDDLYILTKTNEKTVLDIDFVPYNLVAPIKKGDTVGEIIIYKDGVEINRIHALSLDNADKIKFSNILYNIIDKWEICA